jgi:hypothetical protein
MRQIKRIISFLSLILFYTQISTGQESIPATGGTATGAGGSATYTVGQVVYHQFNGSTGFIIQGVQQPYEISIVTAIENTEDITLDCMVYPNPVKGCLKLVIGSFENDNMSFQLITMSGILIQDFKIEDKETILLMDNLRPGIYFLKVIKNNLQVKVFKIVKQ